MADVHLKVGDSSQKSVEYMDESKLKAISDKVQDHSKSLETHSTQIITLEHRADSLSEWMGAIKDWVPQHTGALAGELQKQADRIGVLEAREVRIVEAKPLVPKVDPPKITPEDPKKAERDWVHYFGQKHDDLQIQFNNLQEQLLINHAALKDQINYHEGQPHPIAKSRLPLWITIGLTFSTQIVHLIHYLTHLH